MSVRVVHRDPGIGKDPEPLFEPSCRAPETTFRARIGSGPSVRERLEAMHGPVLARPRTTPTRGHAVPAAAR